VFVAAAKKAEREMARRMRRELGASVKQIAEALQVSQSSVSVWVRDIELTLEQQAALRDMSRRRRVGHRRRSENARAERMRAQEAGRELAHHAPPLHRDGCMLY
jgi:predicted transcriptional regulator